MRTKILLRKISLVLVILVLSECTKTMPKITTSMGVLTIEKVTLTKIDPYTSTSAPDGYQCLGITFKNANATGSGEINNFKIRGDSVSDQFMISRHTSIIDNKNENKGTNEEGKKTNESNVIDDNSSRLIINFQQALRKTYVIADDGSKPIEYWDGLSGGQLFTSCLIKSSAKKFTLYWPGNTPIELIVSK